MSSSNNNNNINLTPEYNPVSPAYPYPREEPEQDSDQEVKRPDTPPPEPRGEVVFVPIAQFIEQEQQRRALARQHPHYNRWRRQHQLNMLQEQQPVQRVFRRRTVVRTETFPYTVSPIPTQRREESQAERLILINRTQQHLDLNRRRAESERRMQARLAMFGL